MRKPEILISRSLAANPINFLIDEEKPYAVAIFEDDDLAVAIGSNGQNIKLASDVTGYSIDVKKRSDYELSQEVDLKSISGLSEKILNVLADNNILTSKDFMKSDEEDLLKIKGFGAKTYEKTMMVVKEAISSTKE